MYLFHMSAAVKNIYMLKFVIQQLHKVNAWLQQTAGVEGPNLILMSLPD